MSNGKDRAAVRVAWRMVVRRPARSSLAALGIAIVVAGLVIAEAVAQRGRDTALREIERIGANVLTVTPAPPRRRGGRPRAGPGEAGGEVRTLTDRDTRELAQVEGVANVAGEFRGTLPLKVGPLARQVSVAGVDVSYGVLRDAPLAAGRFFDEQDATSAVRVAVLGARLAADIAGGPDAVDTEVRLRGIPFVVIGVLEARGLGLDAFDEDETAFVPITTARRRLFEQRHLQRIFMRATRPDRLDALSADILATIGPRHRASGTEKPDIVIGTQERLVSTRRSTIREMNVFRVAVAIILVAAGAAGVFGLQMMSVNERRKEIGVRRALGATRRATFLQFSLESLFVTFAGALTGAALSVETCRLQGIPGSLPIAASSTLACIIAALAASLLPAKRAASTPPAVALRAE